MVNGWKVTAIISLTLLISIIGLVVWGYCEVVEEEEAFNNCYYNTCANYYDAWYESGVCTCYDINDYGEYEIAKTTYNK